MLLYAYVFGISLMIYDTFAVDPARLKRDIADLIARSASVPDACRHAHAAKERSAPDGPAD